MNIDWIKVMGWIAIVLFIAAFWLFIFEVGTALA